MSKLQSTRHYHHLINPHKRYSATRLLRVLLLTLTTSNKLHLLYQNSEVNEQFVS